MADVRPPFGFIIVRHVRDAQTNLYWQRAYRHIRQFHDEPILIIDDNSDSGYLKSELDLVNCQMISGQFPTRAELLPYFYFWKLWPFERAIILHDSVFINQALVPDPKYQVEILWSFSHEHNYHRLDEDLSIFRKLVPELESVYLEYKWTPCFGVMSIISWSFVDLLQRKYNFFPIMLAEITNRNRRMSLERIFGFLISLEAKRFRVIFGDIHKYCRFGISWDNYLDNLKGKIDWDELMRSRLGFLPFGYLFYKGSPSLSRLPAVKVWTGR